MNIGPDEYDGIFVKQLHIAISFYFFLKTNIYNILANRNRSHKSI